MNGIAKGIIFWIFVGGLILSLQPTFFGQHGNAEDLDFKIHGKRLNLSLRDCLILALHNNMDIKVEGLNPDVGLAQLHSARGDFDPMFRIIGDRTKSKQESTFLVEGEPNSIVSTVRDQYAASILGKVFTGGAYELRFSHSRLGTNSFFYEGFVPQYTNDMIISLSQPFLKNGWGSFNEGQIRIASNSSTISRNDFVRKVMEVLFSVESEYWNLLFYRENLDVKKLALKEAEELLRINRIKVEAGVYPGNEIVYALAGVAQRKQEVLQAHKSLQDAEDSLKRQILSLENLEDWEIGVIPIEYPTVPDKLDLDWKSIAMEALEERPDIRGSSLAVKNKEIELDMAENQLLPNLELRGNYSWNAFAIKNSTENFRSLWSEHNRDWGIGLTFEIPLGNRIAEGNLRKARLEKRQTELSHQILIRDVIKDVREAVRRVDTDQKLVHQTSKTVESTLEQLRGEEKKLEVGSSTSYNVLLIQQDLAEAVSNERRAIFDLQIALANLGLAQGNLLAKYGIQVSIQEL